MNQEDFLSIQGAVLLPCIYLHHWTEESNIINDQMFKVFLILELEEPSLSRFNKLKYRRVIQEANILLYCVEKKISGYQNIYHPFTIEGLIELNFLLTKLIFYINVIP